MCQLHGGRYVEFYFDKNQKVRFMMLVIAFGALKQRGQGQTALNVEQQEDSPA
jgi:hypothetical protein